MPQDADSIERDCDLLRSLRSSALVRICYEVIDMLGVRGGNDTIPEHHNAFMYMGWSGAESVCAWV